MDFLRPAECNKLQEYELQQVARHLDGLKYRIRDRIRIQSLHIVVEAHNKVMRTELLIQEKESDESYKRNFGELNQKGRSSTRDFTPHYDKPNDSKVAPDERKQKGCTGNE